MNKNYSYNERIHTWGRIWMFCALLVIFSLPLTVSIMLGEWPAPANFLKGFAATAVIFWTVTTIEVFTFSPMLGNGGAYLGFVTGNLTNLKVPAALNAMQSLDVKMGTDEGDVISTIAIAASSIITTLIIAGGALLLIPLTPVLESPFLKPAFDNIVPALFGALGVVYIAKSWKIAAAPIIFMAMLFLLLPLVIAPAAVPGLVGLFVPLGCIIAITSARILYKTGQI